MPLVDAKCTNCSAPLKVDNSMEAAVCEHCGSAFIVEKAINNYIVTNNISANVVNIYNQSNINTNSDYVIESGKLLKYKGELQEIVIPDEVHIIGKSAFKNTTIRKVVFHNGIVSIEKSLDSESLDTKGAFSGCDNLEEVQIMGINEIPECTFKDCKNLKKAIIYDGVDVIGKMAFKSCSNLTIVKLPKTLKRIEKWAFGFCYSLKEITIPASVKFVDCQSFESCKSLEKVMIEDGVLTIHGGAFLGCKNISSLHFPKSSNIENISLLRGETFTITSDNPFWAERLSELNKPKSGCYIATAVYGSYDCPQV